MAALFASLLLYGAAGGGGLLCRSCGASVVSPSQAHLSSLRLPPNGAVGGLLRGEAHAEPSLDVAAGGGDGTLLHVLANEHLPVPQHMLVRGPDFSAATSVPVASYFEAAAFDAGGLVPTSASPETEAEMASAAMPMGDHRQNSHRILSVHCARCASAVGLLVHSPAGRTSTSTSAATAAAGAAAHVPLSLPPPSATDSGMLLAGPPGPAALPHILGAGEVAALAPLDGACLQFNPGGWWHYEFCHEKYVRQFHVVEHDGHAEPDWSLGTYVRGGGEHAATAAADRASTNTPLSKPARARFDARGAPISYYASHFFTGGQKCDENGRQRATEVQFYCCSDAGGIRIDAIVETSLCRYEMRVCMPSLCAAPTATADAPAGDMLAVASGGGGVASVDGLPRSFFLVYWQAVLAVQSVEYAELATWTPAIGISPVRFGN